MNKIVAYDNCGMKEIKLKLKMKERKVNERNLKTKMK
jgi:hypothetical protein